MLDKNPAGAARRPAVKTIVVLLIGSLASGCATQGGKQNPFVEAFASEDPCANNARNIGMAAGAIAGLIIANQIKHSTAGRVIGSSIGAAIGGLIGANIDRQRCELYKIAKKHDISIQTTSLDIEGKEVAPSDKGKNAVGVSVRLQEPSRDGGHFAPGSDQLTPKAKRYFAEIAETFNPQKIAGGITDPKVRADYLLQAKSRKLFLVGHTDDTGSSQVNAELAERRAQAVAQYLASQGNDPAQIYYQGAGEMYPVADNNTESGRATNRRVEILEVADESVFRNYLARRTANPTLFQPSSMAKAPTSPIARITSNPETRRAEPKSTPMLTSNERAPEKPSSKPALKPSLAKAPDERMPQAAVDKSQPTPNGIDFGGKPYQESDARVDAGKLVEEAGFSFFRKAHADEPAVVASCRFDRPRHAGEIKSLSDGQTFKTTEKLPGLYGRTWRDMIGGHLVVVNQLSVLRDGGQPTNLPEVKIYKDYNVNLPGAKPSMVSTPAINVYQGSNGTLVRSFFNGQGGLRCMDLLVPKNAPFVAKDGRIIYAKASGDYVANFAPRMAD